ncbi:hypothetical protein [Streptomyces atratus]|uniref:hypothetical protein n=1 Tax=Streptomyces atratus TaxID=1893 RepID=UPI0022554212|nr:hypothetical protein [Streptomyces atratus]MCX5342475.1 hypothetical protein [Streptomyces atratus]
MPKRLALLLAATAALLVLQPGSPAYADDIDCGGIELSSVPVTAEGTTSDPATGWNLADGEPTGRGTVGTCDTSWGG